MASSRFPIIGTRAHGGMTPQACVALARLAEASGLAALWFAENPFTRGILPAIAACAGATRRLKLGVGVWNPYNRHPTLMAMEITALDELTDQRAALGIGSGIGGQIEKMGLSYAKPIGAMRDAVAIVRAMLAGAEVHHQGSVFSAAGAKLELAAPRPDLPIYLAAVGDQALRLCGQVADGLMISNMCPPGFTARAVATVRAAAAAAGRPPLQAVVQYVPCIVQPDRAAARAAVKQTIGTMLGAYWRLYAKWPGMLAGMQRESGIPEDQFAAALAALQAGTPAHVALDDRFVDAYAIAGDRDDFEAGAQRFAAVGVTELVVTFVGPAPADDMAQLAPLLARNQERSQ
jgi:5,10-methylenetetrahydromethanopterin reductase